MKDLKLAEGLQLPRAALEKAENGVVVADRRGKVLWSNPAFTRWTGYSAAEVRGRNLRFLKSGEHEPQVYKQLWATIVQGQVWRGVLVNRHRAGNSFAQEQTITPLRNRSGRISHFLGIQHSRKICPQSGPAPTPPKSFEKERLRVARDLHDELGANLTRIKLLSERIEREAGASVNVISHARLISRASRELAESLDGIVWAVDPRKDRLEHLGSYLIAYAEEFLGCAELRFRFEMPAVLPEIPLSAKVRHSVFLVLKEALNNVVKHAQANEVRLGLSVRDGCLEFAVSDDGRGFDTRGPSSGRSGLENMRRRLAELGGTCEIASASNCGTRLRFTVPCQATCPAGLEPQLTSSTPPDTIRDLLAWLEIT